MPERAFAGSILVTGATGLLGASLVTLLSAENVDVVAVGYTRTISLPGVRFVRCDLRSPDSVENLFAGIGKVDWVVHCAAETRVDWCERNDAEAMRVNGECTRWVAQAASRRGGRFVYVSTDSVFDGCRGGYREDDEPHPVNVYGRSKLEGEQAAREKCPEALVLRTNFYGWGTSVKPSLAEWILGLLERKSEVPGFEDVRFNPLLANDLAALILQFIRESRSGLLHVGAKDNASKYAFACMLADAFGKSSRLIRPCRLVDAALPAPRPLNTTLDCHRAEGWIGRALPSVMEGLERFKALGEQGFADKLKAALC